MSISAITQSEEAPIAQLSRSLVISLIAFLTLVDLFATQAILPSLAAHYGVGPAEMSVAVNASTMGMAIAGLGVSLFAGRINRRLGILSSLALLSLPTAFLASLPDLQTFALLRVAQGLCMASAFSLTLAYLAEQCSAKAAAGAFAAYVTGNVASNLFGRILSAGVADHFGLAWNFYLFAGLNLSGALLALAALRATKPMDMNTATPFRAWLEHLKTPALAASFAVGFCILFAFIGTFSFVNFVLVKAPYDLSPMSLGLVYFVFLPSIFTTPLAGRAAQHFGFRQSFIAAWLLALLALPLLMLGSLVLLLIGLALVAVGTFFAQALATGFVGRRASSNRAAASGLYLASYFFGGLLGSALLGEIFVALGWPATLIGIAAALTLALLLSPLLRLKAQSAVSESQR